MTQTPYRASRVRIGILLASTMLCATPALAQEASAQAAAEADTGDIVVTATRREAALNRVPLAVTAITAGQIQDQQLTNFSDLPRLIPGANFVNAKGNAMNIAIRGQVTTADSPSLAVPVAIYQDDIYYGSVVSFDADFFDIGQIAVLRGPQGTTFGRNVVGGALQITSNKPVLGENSGAVSLTVNSFPGAEIQGHFNIPSGDDLAFRMSYLAFRDRGYIDGVVADRRFNDRKGFALRGQFLWEPSDTLRVSGLASVNHKDQLPTGWYMAGPGAILDEARLLGDSPWDSYVDAVGYLKRTAWSTQLRADLDTGLGTLSSITSYRHLFADTKDDNDGLQLPLSPSQNLARERVFSQEIRLVSESGNPIEYVVGAYYSHEASYRRLSITLDGTFPQVYLSTLTGGVRQTPDAIQDVNTNAYAVFGEAKWKLSDQFAITAGGRYTIEEKSGSTVHTRPSAFYGAVYDVDFAETWRAFTPRAVIEYTPTSALLFYASVAKGFKGGGWTYAATTAARAVTPLQPEKTTSYEIGAKMGLFDRALQVNLAAFIADTTNLQVRSLVSGTIIDTNAGAERVKGVEAEITARLSHNFKVGVNYAYTDARYREFAGCTAAGFDCSGQYVPFIPKHDLLVSADYTADIGSGELELHGDVKFASKMWQAAVNNSQPLGRALSGNDGLANASITYRPHDAPWEIQLWGKNLFNEWYIAQSYNLNFYALSGAEIAAGATEVIRGAVNPPRQIGATFRLKF